MHALIFLNGEIVKAARARVAPVSSALLYGRGVFTNVAVYEGRPFLWPLHWIRLVDHALRAGVETGALDQERVGAALKELIEANGVEDGRAHLMLLASRVSGLWKMKSGGAHKSDLLIMTGDAPVHNQEGLALTVSPYRTNSLSPLSGIKTTSYLEHLIAWEEARSRDFDESVRLNERGEVVSAAMSNLFWVIGGTIHTPALSTGAVAGITRARLMALAQELAIPLVEGVYELSDLGHADEIFLTSASLGLALVTTFDFHRYTVHAGSVALRLYEAFRQLTFEAGKTETSETEKKVEES
ncbi:MAG TPA: aminotransferase class IV [Pyrinomonadaceae bacterium]|jgi:branched-subunit amino acid aminotransferase/4-amino-4-deoxychorismate lyase